MRIKCKIMKTKLLIFLLAGGAILSLTFCKKEFIPTEKEKVVVLRSRAYADIELVDKSDSYTIRPFLSTIISDVSQGYSFSGTARGTNSSGDPLGETLAWDKTLSLDSDTTIEELGTDTDYFFLYIKNTSSLAYGPFVVNYGNSDQITENILVPSSSNTIYRIAYYKTHYNSTIRFYEYQNNTNYMDATEGTHFNFPGTENQCVYLQITGKESGIKSSYAAPEGSQRISKL